MSGVLALFGAAAPRDAGVVDAMMARLATRGADRADVRRDPRVVVGACRFGWELAPGFSGDVLVVRHGAVTVAADATLYYLDELRAALRAAGGDSSGETPSALILAAYRAWGAACLDRLEGDFAFVLWDEARREGLCARSPDGKRPLFWARTADGVAVASTVGTLLAHPSVSAELDLGTIASHAAGMWQHDDGTSYVAVKSLPAGSAVAWTGGRPRTWRFWAPPEVRTSSRLRFDEAAEELQLLLRRAVRERLAPAGPSTVWMSGGWDSTAVYGAAQAERAARGDERAIVPVSISYPEGDPGREDELVRAIVDRWDGRVHWLDIADIPFVDRAAERAAHRDESLCHVYETWNRALARGTRAVGSRVAFDGNGGDQYFASSLVFLADLLRTGRWLELARQCRAFGVRSRASLVRWALIPAVPRLVLSAAGALRGRHYRRHLMPVVPSWFRADFLARTGIADREREYLDATTRFERGASETSFFLESPALPRSFGVLASLALDEGVEMRSPLSDPRVVRFAASRPWRERASMGETKRLLRASMRGLLPDHVLAPRRHRTGVTTKYAFDSMRHRFAAEFERAFAQPMLADLGIVDAVALRDAWRTFARTGWCRFPIELCATMHVELWLRARHGERAPSAILPSAPHDDLPALMAGTG